MKSDMRIWGKIEYRDDDNDWSYDEDGYDDTYPEVKKQVPTNDPASFVHLVSIMTEDEIKKVIKDLEEKNQALRSDNDLCDTLLERKRDAFNNLMKEYRQLEYNTDKTEKNIEKLKLANKDLQKRLDNLVKIGVFPWSVDAPKVTNPADDRFISIEIVSHDELIEQKSKPKRRTK